MTYDEIPVTLEKQDVWDSAYIENCNWAYVTALKSEHDMFGKEFVLEDGKITEVHTEFKVIRREDSMVVTTEEIAEMARKLSSVSDCFCQLAFGTDDSDFAIKAWYNNAANDFKVAEQKVRSCLHYCPKKTFEEGDGDEAI